MQDQHNHKWTEDDHIVAFYIYKYSDKGLKYTREELGKKMGMGLNSLNMRIRNYSAVDGAGGLANGSRVVLRIYELHKNTPQQILKTRVETIIRNL